MRRGLLSGPRSIASATPVIPAQAGIGFTRLFGGEGHVGPSPSSRQKAAPQLRFGPAGDRAVPPRQGFGMLFGDRTGPQGRGRSPKSMSTKSLSRAEESGLAPLGATAKRLGLDAEHGTGAREGSCWKCMHPTPAQAGIQSRARVRPLWMPALAAMTRINSVAPKQARMALADGLVAAPRAHAFNDSSNSRASVSGSRGNPARIHFACNVFSTRPTRRPGPTPRATISAPLKGRRGSGVSLAKR